jgi:Chaperone for flagella basal body P-ring formation
MGTRRFISASAGVCLLLLAGPRQILGQCTTTTNAAADLAASRDSVHPLIVDPALQRAWKIVVDCQHPEHPGTMVAVPFHPTSSTRHDISETAVAVAIQKRPAVAGGSSVILRRLDSHTRTELEGTSLRSGRLGERIPIRLANGVVVEGRVTGEALVDLELPPAAWGRQ